MRMVLVVGLAAVTAACATVTRGTKDAWSISTTPPGARVETNSGYFCAATPCAIEMPRKSSFVATVTKPGYKPAQVTVTHKVANAGAAGVAGNVIVGGLIGIGVDTYTGAAMDLTPNPVSLILEKVDEPAATVAAVENHVHEASPGVPTAASPVTTASAPKVAEEPTPAVAKRTCGMVRKANGAMKLAPC